MQNKLLDWVQGILLHGTWEWTHQSCYRDIVACYLASFTRCMGKRLNSILLYKCVFVCGCVFLFHTHTHTHTHCRLMWIGSGMQKFCERTKMFLSHMVSFRFQWQNRQTHTHTDTQSYTLTHPLTTIYTHTLISALFSKCETTSVTATVVVLLLLGLFLVVVCIFVNRHRIQTHKHTHTDTHTELAQQLLLLFAVVFCSCHWHSTSTRILISLPHFANSWKQIRFAL